MTQIDGQSYASFSYEVKRSGNGFVCLILGYHVERCGDQVRFWPPEIVGDQEFGDYVEASRWGADTAARFILGLESPEGVTT